MMNTILFHATSEELYELLGGWIVRFGFYVVGKRFSPQCRVLLPRNSMEAMLRDTTLAKFDELIFGEDIETLSAFVSNSKSFNYPAGFRFMFPSMTSEGLRSGSIDLIMKEPMNRVIWKALIRDVKQNTTAGMWVYSDFNQSKVFNKDLRYTSGIAELTRQGVRLLPFAGNNVVSIDEPHHSQPDDTIKPTS